MDARAAPRRPTRRGAHGCERASRASRDRSPARGAQARQTPRRTARRRVEQIGVVEVDVDARRAVVRRGASGRDHRASESSEARRARDRTAARPMPASRARPTARPGRGRAAARTRRAVDVAELAHASATSSSVYQPPPQKSVGGSARMREATPLGGHAHPCLARRPRMIGRRPVRVMSEGPERQASRALEPHRFVLTECRIAGA